MSAKVDNKRQGHKDCALVLAGGISLGVYHAGAYTTLHERGIAPNWIAASSIGAINAALIAGTPPEKRVAALEYFWGVREDLPPYTKSIAEVSQTFRHLQCWGSAVQSRLLGVPGNFTPRLFQPAEGFASLYDLDPLRSQIERKVDFDLLNSGSVHISVMTTDLETGEGVLFDTAKGDPITIDHLMASCGLPPEFASVEIDGRVLGDGGLWANAPIEPVLQEADGGLCILVDTYARDGERPTGIESGLDRKIELMFANQTWHQLEAYKRELALREQLAELNARVSKGKRKPELKAQTKRRPPAILHVGYRAPDWEAGPERPFDYARDTLSARWASGARDMLTALDGAA